MIATEHTSFNTASQKRHFSEAYAIDGAGNSVTLQNAPYFDGPRWAMHVKMAMGHQMQCLVWQGLQVHLQATLLAPASDIPAKQTERHTGGLSGDI
jgi:hypothetical protein